MINYQELIEEQMRQLLPKIFKILEEKQRVLGSEDAFIISFITYHPGLVISDRLQKKYSKELTIILQHQFSDLVASDDFFKVKLQFSGLPEQLLIPYDAITQYADQKANFVLNFSAPEMDDLSQADDRMEEEMGEDDGVIILDNFRK